MPKQTFFNLTIQKQDNLIDAAMKEFSRVPLHEAVISNIIKNAEISRGSFYQYFEDIEDLFFYLLEQHLKQNNERFSIILKDNDGDLLESFIDMFKTMLKDFQNEEHRVFFRNMFLNMNYKMDNAFTNNIKLANIKNLHSEMLPFINTNKMNISDDRELVHVMQIIKAITFQNLTQSFAMQLSPEEALANYTTEMNMLKRGLYHNDYKST